MNPQNAILVAELSKTLVKRILDVNPNIPRAALEEMSLAGLLNILFLHLGSYGSVGDYCVTARALRHLVGDDYFWKWPAVTSVEAPKSVN